MKSTKFIRQSARAVAIALTFLAPAALSLSSLAADMAVKLSGAQEVPPVTTNAAATGNISVGDNGMVSGAITTTGIDATAAHIHEGAVGKNGGVIVPLVKNGATFLRTAQRQADRRPDEGVQSRGPLRQRAQRRASGRRASGTAQIAVLAAGVSTLSCGRDNLKPPGKEEIDACRACPLYARATQGVPGEGPRNASIMLVGEQPGDTEDLAGRPFVGPAGRLLRGIMADAGPNAHAVYITNSVKHFTGSRAASAGSTRPQHSAKLPRARSGLMPRSPPSARG